MHFSLVDAAFLLQIRNNRLLDSHITRWKKRRIVEKRILVVGNWVNRRIRDDSRLD